MYTSLTDCTCNVEVGCDQRFKIEKETKQLILRKRMMNSSAKLKKIGEVKKEEVVGKRLLKRRIQMYPAL